MFLGVFFVICLFAAQLVVVQGIDSGSVAAEALSGRTKREAIPALRGTITDSKGEILATSLERRTVTADPQAVPTYRKKVNGTSQEVGVAGAAADLAPLLGKSETELARLMRLDGRYVILAKDITPLAWNKINALGIPGIASERTSQRSYPQSTTAASLVGFVTDDGQAGGGLELLLNDTIGGTAGEEVYEVSQGGNRLPQGFHQIQDAQSGKDVRLTLNNDLQWYAQNVLANQVRETKALSGTVVVQSVKTGELLALASFPTYDPNNIGKAGDVLTNHAFSDVFEPGSTAKIMVMAAALQEGVATPSTKMIVPDSLYRGGARLNDSHPHPEQYLTLAGALAQSSNTGTLLIGEKMSADTLDGYFRKFGLGSGSGLNFPGESAGLLVPPAEMDGTQRYTVMYGQGVSVTAIQAAGVFQTIANDGVRLAPRLVAGVSDGKGGWTMPEVAPGTQVVSADTAKKVNRMLEGVVSTEGTAPEARIPGYRVAGKTGTAERYDMKKGGYSGKTASFIGFAPADDPEIVTAVILQRPIKGYYGGTVAAPVFRKVMTYALRSQKVPPTPGSTKPGLKLVLNKAPSRNDPSVVRDRGQSGR